MQSCKKLHYKDFQYIIITLDEILNTPDESDHGYCIVFDMEYANECKEQLALMTNKRTINDNELDYREKEKEEIEREQRKWS